MAFITWESFQSVLEHAIIATLPTNSDIPQRQKLVRAAAAEYEKAMARASNGGRPIKATRFGIRVCAWPPCGVRFAARSYRHTYHSGACRTAAYEARKADGAARGDVSTVTA